LRNRQGVDLVVVRIRSDKLDERDLPAEIERDNQSIISARHLEPNPFAVQNLRLGRRLPPGTGVVKGRRRISTAPKSPFLALKPLRTMDRRTMTWSNVAKGAAIVALLSSAPIAAGAMEIVGGPSPAGAVNDSLIATVAQAHAGARVRVHGAQNKQVNRQVNQNVHVNRNVHANVNVNRNVHVNGDRPGRPATAPARPESIPVAKPPVAVGGWARPGWYHWAPGGAIAAGAALGFVTAATATWATPPQPGLCWYYTDPSQQDGFWDACP